MTVYGLSNEGFVLPKAEEMAGKGKQLKAAENRDNRNLIRGIIFGFIGFLIAGGIWMSISWKGNKEVLPVSTQTPSIAVMPFVDLSPKQDQAFLGDGMAEEVINLLTRESELNVSSRSSSFSFKKQKADMATIVEKLGVGYILEGSVKEFGGKIKISVQLIDASLDKSIWAASWEEEVEDLFGIQESIAKKVMEALKINLLDARKWKIEKTSPDAYRLFLQARYQYLTESNVKEARQLVERSIGLDSTYAPAWILWAQIDNEFALRGVSPTGIKGFEALLKFAIRHAHKGIKLNPESGTSYATLASLYHNMFGKRDSARYYIGKALELAPGDAHVLATAGFDKCLNGEGNEGLALLNKAAKLDPLSFETNSFIAYGCLISRQYEIAKSKIKKWLRIQPKTGFANYQMALCLLAQERIDEAKYFADNERVGGLRICVQSIVAWKQGNTASADALLAELIEDASADAAYQIAQIYGYREDAEKSFEWLERSYDQYDPGLIQGPTDAAFDFLHGDPRWEPFAEKVRK